MPMREPTIVGMTPDTVTVLPRHCLWCRKGHEEPLTVSREAYARWLDGAFAQDCFPTLTKGQRELLISGTHDECFTAMFPEEDEEEPPPLYLIDDEPTKGPEWEWNEEGNREGSS